jgi:hypothetical protein
LTEINAKIADGDRIGKIMDSNGNSIGQWSLELPDDKD